MLMWATSSSLDKSSPQINKAVFRRVANKLNKFRGLHIETLYIVSGSSCGCNGKCLRNFVTLQSRSKHQKVWHKRNVHFTTFSRLYRLFRRYYLPEIMTSCGTIDINRTFTTKRAVREECCAIALVMEGKSSQENSSILHFVFFSFHHQAMYFFSKLIEPDFADSMKVQIPKVKSSQKTSIMHD